MAKIALASSGRWHLLAVGVFCLTLALVACAEMLARNSGVMPWQSSWSRIQIASASSSSASSSVDSVGSDTTCSWSPYLLPLAEQKWAIDAARQPLPTLVREYRRLLSVQLAQGALLQGVPGDFVETGVFRGGTAILLLQTLAKYDVGGHRKLWAADSFQGLPDPVEQDQAGDTKLLTGARGEYSSPLDEFNSNLKQFGVDLNRLQVLKGWFNETLPGAPIDKVSFLRLDGDLVARAPPASAGLIQFSCDDKGNSKCICESAGLASCFPGAATVATPAGPKRLADLQLGEAVLALDPATGALAFSPVYMWTSRRPGQEAQFLTVRTDAGLNLTVTPGHYLFAWRGEGAAEAAAAALARPQSWPYVLPGQLAPGDVVPVVAAAWEGSRHVELAHVTAVERGDGHGVFMPHTLTGAIVVDGVVASELTSVVPPALAGPTLQRCLAASLRCAARLLPTSTLEAAVRLVSGWVHGVADAALSAHTLLAVS